MTTFRVSQIVLTLMGLYIIGTAIADIVMSSENYPNEEIKYCGITASSIGILYGILIIGIVFIKRKNNLNSKITDISTVEYKNTGGRVVEVLLCLAITAISVIFLLDKISEPYTEKFILKSDKYPLIIEMMSSVVGIIMIWA